MEDKSPIKRSLGGAKDQYAERQGLNGTIVPGKIIGYSDGYYTVRTTRPRLNLTKVINVVGVITSGALGFQTLSALPIGERVLVLISDPNYILKVLPRDRRNPQGSGGPKHSGVDGNPVVGKVSGLPQDMIPGEFNIQNAFNVMMRFATGMLGLSATARAKVELHLHNEMVRVVSQQFRHHCALGDFNITRDGRNNLEFNATSYPHEMAGKMNSTQSNYEAVETYEDQPLDDETRFGESMRARLKAYVGYAGDFIHLLVTDPQEFLYNSLAADTNNDPISGRFSTHVSTDGSFLLQSVADIAIERVHTIIVPKRKTPVTTSHADTSKYDELTEEPLKPWEHSNPKNPFEMAYQLRNYARWLSQRNAMARRLQLEDEWLLESEENHREPFVTRGESDRKPELIGLQAYSTIRIMRDGSIVVRDGFGSNVALVNGNIDVASARHLNLEAAGDVRVFAGRNLIMKARRNIELIAQVGGLIIKCRTALHAICEWGSIWLKSDAKHPSDPAPHTPDEGEASPEVLEAGIMLDATRSGVKILAEEAVHLRSKGEYDPEKPRKNAIILEATSGELQLSSSKNLKTTTGGDWLCLVDGNHIHQATHFYMEPTTTFNVGNVMTVNRRELHTSRIVATQGDYINKLSGPERGPDDPNPAAQPALKFHYNHVDKVDPAVNTELANDDSSREERRKILSLVGAFPDDFEGDAPIFQFFSDSEYYWCSQQKNTLYQSLAQQAIEFEDPQLLESRQYTYGTWDLRMDTLEAAPRNSVTSRPFGGHAKQFVHEGGESLNKRSTKQPKDHENKAEGWKLRESVVFHFLKPNE